MFMDRQTTDEQAEARGHLLRKNPNGRSATSFLLSARTSAWRWLLSSTSTMVGATRSKVDSAIDVDIGDVVS